MHSYIKLPKDLLEKLHKRYGKTIRVGLSDYKILFAKRLVLNEEAVDGFCCDEQKVIALCYSKNRRYMEATLLHELGHAFCAENGMRQLSGWSMNVEELFVENLSTTLSKSFKFSA